jgi:hypothetical protein
MPRESLSAAPSGASSATEPGDLEPGDLAPGDLHRSNSAELETAIQLPDESLRGMDRRGVVRVRFPHRQFVAPYHGGCIPSRASFKEVVCRDISEQGFSFLASCQPDFDMLVVALGVPPNVTYMTARIVNRIRVSAVASPLYRIGCRFTGRLT